MCQDDRVFDAMMHAGTPCPYDGMIGAEAKAAWKAEADEGIIERRKRRRGRIRCR